MGSTYGWTKKKKKKKLGEENKLIMGVGVWFNVKGRSEIITIRNNRRKKEFIYICE
jgi:hypothetical protein